jgi:hypothetical protein
VTRQRQTLGYALRDTDAWFQISDDLIYIGWRLPIFVSILLWTMAAVMIAVRVIHEFPSLESWLGIDQTGAEGWKFTLLYFAIVLLFVASGIQRTVVRIDLKARRVSRDVCWGPFRFRRVQSLHAFDRILLERDQDGHTTVQLRDASDDVSLTLVSNEGRRQSVQVAHAIAKRLKMPLIGLDEDDEVSEEQQHTEPA